MDGIHSRNLGSHFGNPIDVSGEAMTDHNKPVTTNAPDDAVSLRAELEIALQHINDLNEAVNTVLPVTPKEIRELAHWVLSSGWVAVPSYEQQMVDIANKLLSASPEHAEPEELDTAQQEPEPLVVQLMRKYKAVMRYCDSVRDTGFTTSNSRKQCGRLLSEALELLEATEGEHILEETGDVIGIAFDMANVKMGAPPHPIILLDQWCDKMIKRHGIAVRGE
ncbi:hypothetical protein OAA60_00770 [Porticoccaceae bacterium]|nr:hypothetical protein [Porticoccaceae bacterium]